MTSSIVAADDFPEMRLRPFDQPVDINNKPVQDSLINYGHIKAIVSKYRSPVAAMNELAKDGWELATTVVVPTLFNKIDERLQHRIYYYLRKEWK
jgi:hypothetical protein